MDAAKLLTSLLQAARNGPEPVLAALAPSLEALGFTRRRTQASPAAELWTRGERPRLLLSGHVDVVPVGEGWTRDPFGGEVAEGRVWGRGACDMLGSIACFVAAAAQEPDAPCGILLTTDEETGMSAAEHALAEGLAEGFEAAVVGEPTDFAVGIAEKGVLWLRLATSGRNAHGSMPELGDNAADRLVRAVAAVRAVPVPGQHPLLGRATQNLGRLHSGDAINQVPARGAAELDVRYLPGTEAGDIIAAFEQAARAVGEEAQIEVISHHEPFETPQDDALVRAALEAVREVGREARALGLPYGTEASKLAPAGIACIILGPGEAGLAHTNRESIALDALEDAVALYAHILRRHASGGPA